MDTIPFAEEFTQLILRWTKPGKNAAAPGTPLTSQEIVCTLQNVLNIILGIDFQVPDYSTVTTPASGIAVCTPSAPVVPKIEPSSANLSRFRSLDTLTSATQTEPGHFAATGSLPSESQENMDTVGPVTTDALSAEKKFMSRSIPAINVTTQPLSDTFVQEAVTQDANNNNNNKSAEEKFDVFDKSITDFFSDPEKTLSRQFLKKLESLQKSAYDVVAQIDDLKKNSCPQPSKPRRLSSIGGLSRSSTMLRPVPPPKLRRSSTGFPGTPTSSKLNTTITAKNDAALKRKSVVPGVTTTTTKLSGKSPSNRPMAAPATKSPQSTSVAPKSAKYAHVQSTIPKSSLAAKRKAQ